MDAIVKYIVGEWHVITAAPATFILALMVSLTLIWLAMSWGYGRENSLLKQQVADYKEKLSGATPSEARAEIEGLRAELRELSISVVPRRISVGDRAALMEVLRLPTETGDIQINSDGSCSDCAGYANDVASVFRDSGKWRVHRATVLGAGGDVGTGLILCVPPHLIADSKISIIESAFGRTDIPFCVRHKQGGDLELRVRDRARS
jgi:hypothetical protein